LDTFSPYAHEVSFFLNQKRYRNACLRAGGTHEEPPAALLDSVCLWAACISSSEPLASQENNFLSRALSTAPTVLSSAHRLKIVFGIQTEVLLCQYFLHKGRLLEAQYHLSVAVSYVVLGDLSSIRSSRGSGSHKSPAVSPQDCVEEGETIIAFWTVFSLDKILSSTLDFPSNFAGPVDSPWPLEMEGYERNQLPYHLQSTNTVQKFEDDVGDEGDGFSCLAMLTKSAILLARATVVAREWRANMTPAETAAFLKLFTKLNNRIQKFRDGLPPPTSLVACPSAARPRLILAHTVADAATIQLNRTFTVVNPRCKELCLAGCRSIVWIVQTAGVRNIAYMNPIIGALWAATSQILSQQIARPNAAAVIADLTSASNEIVACVTAFSRNCPFMCACG
ncbi:hypothetical protein B0H19DRAFT_953535, partial [Mycena capillaripes]